MLEGPESPASTFSVLSGSPPALDLSTLSILNSFLSSRDQERTLFNQLAEQTVATHGLGIEVSPEDVDDEDIVNPMISVDEYRAAFGEDWQLSQFWYSTTFATQLARSIRSICKPSDRVAFLCSPTAFVAFQHEYSWKKAHLLEFDSRFSVLDPKRFVHYDLNEPDVFPEGLRGAVDIAVVDPPFLNEITNKKIATTLRQILNPDRGKLIILTSTSVEDVLKSVYTEPPLGPLRKAIMDVEHGQLANDFACWSSWDGAETFGATDPTDTLPAS
ncbi:Protein-lysine N-methyltransferase efm5 [Marasmius tenuissimus]|uniref:Protein-lysine N-methyltransferase efm5 n=1 Tax=Marasmius tenuissimus TaxID=585030 RepID=A0ABR3A3S2_9AGAR